MHPRISENTIVGDVYHDYRVALILGVLVRYHMISGWNNLSSRTATSGGPLDKSDGGISVPCSFMTRRIIVAEVGKHGSVHARALWEILAPPRSAPHLYPGVYQAPSIRAKACYGIKLA